MNPLRPATVLQRPADWGSLAALVERVLGLRFPPQRHADLRRMFASAVPALGFEQADACIEALLAQPPTRRQVQVLAQHLAIGETYFWRDAGQLQVLASHVLAPLIAARRGGLQRLRLWSVACSTGEEAYTLAMLVRGLLGHEPGWQVDVLGTDVRVDALARAAVGCYGEWSFRRLPAALRARFFTPTPDGQMEVVPEIRRITRFVPANLVGDLAAWAGADFDLVVCRNVLMYFGAEQASRATRDLHACLAMDGFLALGAGELPTPAWDGYARMSWPEAVLLRKCEPATAVVGQATTATARPAPPQADAQGEARRIRALADRGRTAEALRACEHWLRVVAAHDAPAHHLYAMVLQEQGVPAARVRDALDNALRCDSAFVLAHFALGRLARAEGHVAQARQHFQDVQALLAEHQPQQVVAASDGMTAAALAEIVAALLLQEAAP